jgi:hypothetical protein
MLVSSNTSAKEGFLYLLRADWLATRGEETGTVALGENTEERDSVGHGGKVGVKAVLLGAKGRPDRPEVVSGGGVADTQALAGLVLIKAECTMESSHRGLHCHNFPRQCLREVGEGDQSSRQEVVSRTGGACENNRRPWYCWGPGYGT